MNVSIVGFFKAFIGAFFSALADVLRRGWGLLAQLGRFVERWLTAKSISEYGVSVARIGLGLGGLGMLLANWSTRYYSFGSGVAWSGERLLPVSDFPKIPIFSLFYSVSMDDTALTSLYLLLMGLCVLVIVGYRMRITLPIFGVMWVSFAEMTDFLGDQGDNIFRMALIALLFTDTSARWSLDSRRRSRFRHLYAEKSWFWGAWHGAKLLPAWLRNASQNLAVVVIAAQVSFIYVAGSLYKAGGYPWSSGQAIYYPLNVDRFGTWPILSDIITHNDFVVGVLTYGALLSQLAFPFLLLNKYTRKVGIIAITGVHLGIGLLMGLPWFSITMIALDMIFVSDRSWRLVADWFRGIGTATRQRVVGESGSGEAHDAPSVPEKADDADAVTAAEPASDAESTLSETEPVPPDSKTKATRLGASV